jgi:NADH-quinone oxidoreductase subunit C
MTETPLTPEDVLAALGEFGPVEAVRKNRIRVTVPRDRAREAIARTIDGLRCDHLIQIASVDTGKTFELHYHLTGPHRTVVTVRTELPRDAPDIASVHDLLPPAALYERQIHDLMGIRFEGHPDLRRIILNEEWPEGEFPLRKDWKMDPSKSYGGAGEGVD